MIGKFGNLVMKKMITLTMKSNMLAEGCLPPSAVSLIKREKLKDVIYVHLETERIQYFVAFPG